MAAPTPLATAASMSRALASRIAAASASSASAIARSSAFLPSVDSWAMASAASRACSAWVLMSLMVVPCSWFGPGHAAPAGAGAGSGRQQHQVVAVDHVAAVVVAQDRLDVARVAAGDAGHVHRRVLADAAGHGAHAAEIGRAAWRGMRVALGGGGCVTE